MYTFAGWVAYVAVWYTGIMPVYTRSAVERAIRVSIVFLGPVV